MLSRNDTNLLHALRRRRHREEVGLFLAEGVRVVEELIASNIDVHLAVVASSMEDTSRGRALLSGLAGRGRVERVTDAEIARLAATETPQGVLAAAAIPRTAPGAVRLRPSATCLLLDGVQDPGNFGTLVRSAVAFGVAAVVALPGTVDAWNPKSVRAASGSSFHVPILQVGWPAAIEWLRREDFRVFAADAAGTPIQSVANARRTALVVGNEGSGLSAEARTAADETVAVPIDGPAESLNVAVAAGILLYMLTRGS